MRPTRLLWPKLVKFLPRYPDIKVEISIDYGLTDIVAQRFDAGVRAGEQVAKDMIAVRIGPDNRMAVVGAPSYFRKRAAPMRPQDLIGHDCINLRLTTYGGLYPWEFEKAGREIKVRVEGQLAFNGAFQMLNTGAQSGFGLACVPEDLAASHIAGGRLRRVLDDWCAPCSRAIISTILADASPRRLSACWLRRCAHLGIRGGIARVLPHGGRGRARSRGASMPHLPSSSTRAPPRPFARSAAPARR